MPRKPAAGDATKDSDPPRRSTRISSQPSQPETIETMPKTTAPKKAKTAKKRNLDNEGEAGEQEGDGEETKVKKAKVDQEDVPALSPIDIGGSLPSLTLKNEKDEDIDVSTLAVDKGVVLFIVPAANTPGCTTQACGFRDVYPDFSASNYNVYCLSSDTTSAQSKWQTKQSLPFPLLSDRKRVLIKALTGNGTKTVRSHFVFSKGGVLVDKKIPVKPADSPKLALEFIKRNQAESSQLEVTA